MELSNPEQNRKAGFLGVTIATLLTPGGKLFTSAVAASLVVGAVALNEGPKQEQAPNISEGALNIESEILDADNLSTTSDDTLSPQTLAFGSPTLSSQPAFAIQAMPPIHVAGIESPSSTPGFSMPSSFGGMSAYTPTTTDGGSSAQDCKKVLVDESGKVVVDKDGKVICLDKQKTTGEGGTGDEGSPTSEIIAGYIPDSTSSGDNSPSATDNSLPVEDVGDKSLPVEDVGPSVGDLSPSQAPQSEDASFAPMISVTAVPEPATLALFLLGLAGFAQVYRKRKAS